MKTQFDKSSRGIRRPWQLSMHTIKVGGDGGEGNTIASSEDLLPHSEELCFASLSMTDIAQLLQWCGRQKNRMLALRLHRYMRENGLDTHRSLGNYLIPLLVDVGKLDDAVQIFNRFEYRNEWSWNSLINGYVACGKSQDALKLYQTIQRCGLVHGDGHTFVAALKACVKLKDLEQGSLIHEEIAKTGLLHKNIFVANTVIDMYSKCGSLLKSQQVFDELPKRSVVSWNALITGYAEYGYGRDAIACLKKMQLDGILPNEVTFLSALKACGSLKAVQEGIDIHIEVERQGLQETHPLIGTALVDLYSKCGLLAKAQQVFDRLCNHDVVCWTALIVGYADHGHGKKALQCFKQMHREGITPNAATFIGALKACATVGALENGQEIHAKIGDMRLVGDNVLVGTALIDMYSKSGFLDKAQQLFDKLPCRDIISWNALVAGYTEHGLGDKALECFEQMQLDGVPPDEVTYIFTLKACGSIGATEKGAELHETAESQGFLRKCPLVGNSVVDMYSKCGLLSKAKHAFDRLQQRDVVTWTSLIVGYTEHGLDSEAINCLEIMQGEGVSPNSITFIGSLKACGNIGAVDKGIEIHSEIERQGLRERDLVVGTSLVDMYAKCGCLAKAQEVFRRIPTQDGVCWTTLLGAHAQLGETANVFGVFEKMLEEGIKPNMVTFVVLLTVCRRGCVLDKSQTYFETMSKDFGIARELEHVTCVLSLLGCTGQLERAAEIMKRLPYGLDSVAWSTMLGVYRHMGSMEIGKHAFKHVLQCTP